MPTRPSSADLIARRLANLERTVKARLRKGQLGHSSYEGQITHFDGDVVGTVIGKQYDGTAGAVALNGPVPPTPTMPVAVSVPGGLLLTWDGTFPTPAEADRPVVAPLDFARVETEVSTSPEFLVGETRLGPAFSSASGGEAYLAWLVPGEILYVRAYTRATTGRVSPRSLTAGPVAAGKVGTGDLDFDLASYVAGHSVTYGTEEPADAGVGALWLHETDPGPPPVYEVLRWDGDSWEPVSEAVSAEALAAAIAAQQAADAKAQIFRRATAPLAAEILGDDAVWFDTANGNRANDWTGTAWTPRLLGNGAIAPASLIASALFVTGTITAPLLDVLLVLTSVVVAGDPNGEHARLDPTGLSAYVSDPVSGLPVQVARLGRALGVIDPVSRQTVASISEAGFLGVQGGSVANADDFYVGGQTIPEWLWNLPWGVQARAKLPNIGGPYPRTDTELPWFEMAFQAVPGREYMLRSEPFEVTSLTGNTVRMRLRYTNDDGVTVPTITSQTLHDVNVITTTRATWSDNMTANWPLPEIPRDQNGELWRLLVTYGAGSGAGLSTGAAVNQPVADLSWWIEDIGPIPPMYYVMRAFGGGTTGGPGGSTVQTFNAQWHRTWRQNGTTISSDAAALQGSWDSLNGNQRSAIGFEDLSGVLAGATVSKVELYLYAETWQLVNGGTAHLGYHGATGRPATWPGQSGPFNVGFARNQGKWIDVTQWAAGLKAGTIRGVSLVGGTSEDKFAGRFQGFESAHVPQLRVTYTK